MGVVTRNRYARSDYKGFPSDYFATWTPKQWERFCAPCKEHPADYCVFYSSDCYAGITHRSHDSDDSNGAGLNLGEEPRTAGQAGGEGLHSPDPSRLIYINFSNTSGSSLKRWGLL